MPAPVGTVQDVTVPQLVVPLSRLYVSVSGGDSGSVAVAVNVRVFGLLTGLLPIDASTGRSFTGVTVIVKVWGALVSTPLFAVPPLSWIRTVTVATPLAFRAD